MNMEQLEKAMLSVSEHIAMIGGNCKFKLDKYHAEMLHEHLEEESKRVYKYKIGHWNEWNLTVGHSMFCFDTISLKFKVINMYLEAPIETHFRRKYDFRSLPIV